MLSGALPNYSLYKCRDGRYLAIGALEPKFFKRVLNGLLESAPGALRATLRKAMPQREERAEGGPARETNSIGRMQEMFGNPAKARRMLAPLRWMAQWSEYLRCRCGVGPSVKFMVRGIRQGKWKVTPRHHVGSCSASRGSGPKFSIRKR